MIKAHNGIESYFRGRLELELDEYRGTHKQHISLTETGGEDRSITQVNTISYRDLPPKTDPLDKLG